MLGIGLGQGLLKELAMRDRVYRVLVHGPFTWTTDAGTMPGPWLPILDSKMLNAMQQASARQHYLTSLIDPCCFCSLRNAQIAAIVLNWCIPGITIGNKIIASQASLGIPRPRRR